MEAIRAGRLDPPPAAVLFGLEVLEVDEGRVVFGFTPHERFSNWQPTHGGVLAAVTDFALTTAVLTSVPLGTAQARATGSVVHVGRTLAHAEVVLEDANGGLLVRASGTCRLRDPR